MNIKAGFFTIETLQRMDAAPTLETAKWIAEEAITDQPNARESNKKKAKTAIMRASSKKQLLITAANFMLAHPSEGLSMNKD